MIKSAQGWDSEYSQAKQQADQLLRQLNASNPHMPDMQQKAKMLDRSIKALETGLLQMERQPAKFQINNQSDLAKRRSKLEEVKHARATARQKIESKTGQTNFGQFNNPTSDAGRADRSAMSDAQLLAQQTNMMAEQDRMLEQISKGVGNLHNYGKVIGEEAQLHVSLLDDLDQNVDKAHHGLRAETAHADKVNRQAGNCRLYICIIVLIIILVALLVVGSR